MTATDTNMLDLEPIKARCREATEGPWEVHGDYGLWSEGLGVWVLQDDCLPGGTLGGGDAEFIAHARTDIPALVAEIEHLRAEKQSNVTGTPVAFDFHNGKPRDAACGLEDCECPDHEWEHDHPRQPGLYVTFRVTGTDHARFGRRWNLTETDDAASDAG